MKSPVIIDRTSGRRNICAVPVVWSRSFGAIRFGFGDGSAVRCGLRLNALVMAGAEAGGATNVISG